jgi:hypothetical protein
MTRKSLIAVSLLSLAACVIAASFVFFAGVRLWVGNQSQIPIQNIAIEYGRGTLTADRLDPGTNFKRSLGKIGEGADFTVKWNNGQKAKFNIYFDGLWGYNKVRIIFLPSGRVILSDNDTIYEPITSERT